MDCARLVRVADPICWRTRSPNCQACRGSVHALRQSTDLGGAGGTEVRASPRSAPSARAGLRPGLGELTQTLRVPARPGAGCRRFPQPVLPAHPMALQPFHNRQHGHCNHSPTAMWQSAPKHRIFMAGPWGQLGSWCTGPTCPPWPVRLDWQRFVPRLPRAGPHTHGPVWVDFVTGECSEELGTEDVRLRARDRVCHAVAREAAWPCGGTVPLSDHRFSAQTWGEYQTRCTRGASSVVVACFS